MPSRLRGAHLISAVAVVREVIGPVQYSALITACPPETRQLLQRTLVAVEWVPVDLWFPFLQTLFEQICQKNEAHLRKLLRATCKREFSSIYRAFLNQVRSGRILFGKTAAIWSAYYDSGSLSAEPLAPQNGQQRYLLRLRDLETRYPICLVGIQAYIEQILSMVGVKSLTVQRSAEQLRDGRLSCEFTVQFSE